MTNHAPATMAATYNTIEGGAQGGHHQPAVTFPEGRLLCSTGLGPGSGPHSGGGDRRYDLLRLEEIRLVFDFHARMEDIKVQVLDT